MTEQETLEHLDRALDAILAVRQDLGGLPDDLPDVALDAALGADENYQRAREELSVRMTEVAGLVGPFDRDAVLGLESAVNGLVSQGVAVGWRLGLLAAGGSLGGVRM